MKQAPIFTFELGIPVNREYLVPSASLQSFNMSASAIEEPIGLSPIPPVRSGGSTERPLSDRARPPSLRRAAPFIAADYAKTMMRLGGVRPSDRGVLGVSGSSRVCGLSTPAVVMSSVDIML